MNRFFQRGEVIEDKYKNTKFVLDNENKVKYIVDLLNELNNELEVKKREYIDVVEDLAHSENTIEDLASELSDLENFVLSQFNSYQKYIKDKIEICNYIQMKINNISTVKISENNDENNYNYSLLSIKKDLIKKGLWETYVTERDI